MILFLQIFVIVSGAKHRQLNENKFIKSVFPHNYKSFWLESAVEGIFNETEARGAIIRSETLLDLEKSLSNHITIEFSKRPVDKR